VEIFQLAARVLHSKTSLARLAATQDHNSLVVEGNPSGTNLGALKVLHYQDYAGYNAVLGNYIFLLLVLAIAPIVSTL